MDDRLRPTSRNDYPYFGTMPTRWGDNDAYGHINNVAYYAFFDSAVNRHLIESGVLDVASSSIIGLVVETRCSFFSSVQFPDTVHVGLQVSHLGNSSVRYAIGLFRNDDPQACAVGLFVHVYVERASNRPVPVPPAVRAALRPLMA